MSEPLKYIILIIITAFMAAGVYIYKPISKSVDAFTVSRPCSEPFLYSIGNPDSRFSISKQEVTDAAHAAATLWNRSSNNNVLILNDQPSEESEILIQLVYDERQQRTDSELRFRERIRSEQLKLDREQASHDRKRDRFELRSEEYRKLTEETTQELNKLNNWVQEKNAEGGFTGSDLEQFENRKANVEGRQDKVRQRRQELDHMAQSINKEMEMLNEAYANHNRLIDQYNKEYAGDLRFTKATFQKTPNGGVVTVSQFMNKKELTLIIAHELGHALGIDHLDTPESIMYSRMGAQQLNPILQLSDSDVAAVKEICN